MFSSTSAPKKGNTIQLILLTITFAGNVTQLLRPRPNTKAGPFPVPVYSGLL